MPPTSTDHYAILEVDPTSDAEEIKAAYLRQVFRWHPDRNPSAEATQRTAAINAAWETLQDPTRRADYDRKRRAGRTRPAPARTSTPRARPPRAARTTRPERATPNPATAERARRHAEAAAREAEARRRRDEEYERRRRASEHLWQPPPESGLGWSDRDFVIGHWYRDNRGPYRVIDVRDRQIDVYYADGDVATLRREDHWRHWQHRAQGRVRTGRPASRPR